MKQEKHLGRGIVAGLAAGLVASWVMNEFMAGPGQKLQDLMKPPADTRYANQGETPNEDATMKTADAVVNAVTGGQHLSWEEREKAGPVVHYTFGGLMGAMYGGLAELWPGVRSGFGTTFASALFAGADLIAVPVLRLGPSPMEQPATAQVPHWAAHLVYGFTTEVVRRTTRALL